MKFPIDKDVFIQIVRKNGGDDNMVEIALAIVSIANEAVICGLTPEKARNIKEFAA